MKKSPSVASSPHSSTSYSSSNSENGTYRSPASQFSAKINATKETPRNALSLLYSNPFDSGNVAASNSIEADAGTESNENQSGRGSVDPLNPILAEKGFMWRPKKDKVGAGEPILDVSVNDNSSEDESDLMKMSFSTSNFHPKEMAAKASQFAKMFKGRRRSSSMNDRGMLSRPNAKLGFLKKTGSNYSFDSDSIYQLKNDSVVSHELADLESENLMTTGSQANLHPAQTIRVRVSNKKVKELFRLHLTQDFNGGASMSAADFSKTMHGANLRQLFDASCYQRRASHEDKSWPIKGATFAMKLDFEDLFLAVAGEDGILRIWKVPKSRVNTSERMNPRSEDESYLRDANSNAANFNANPSNNDLEKAEKTEEPGFVFAEVPEIVFVGHSAGILDIAWSRHHFVATASLDRTVRLWHVEHEACLCIFEHPDCVTSVHFHPFDDRFLLSGCLDARLRIWSLEAKKLQAWNELASNACITAVSFNQDGTMAIVGTHHGDILFYETDGLKYNTQIQATAGKPAKITGIAPLPFSAAGEGDDLILVTATDSRVKMFNMKDKSLVRKFKGAEIGNSQIRASFSRKGDYVICGSDDKCVYVWNTVQTHSATAIFGASSRWPGFKPWHDDSARANSYEKFSLPDPVTAALFWQPGLENSLGDKSVSGPENGLGDKFASGPENSLGDKSGLENHSKFPLDSTFIIAADINGRIRILSNCHEQNDDVLLTNSHFSNFSQFSHLSLRPSAPIFRTDTRQSKPSSLTSLNSSIHSLNSLELKSPIETQSNLEPKSEIPSQMSEKHSQSSVNPEKYPSSLIPDKHPQFSQSSLKHPQSVASFLKAKFQSNRKRHNSESGLFRKKSSEDMVQP